MGVLVDAQTWHDANHGCCEENGYSTCFCCCTLCDPDWFPATPNPYFAEATGDQAKQP